MINKNLLRIVERHGSEKLCRILIYADEGPTKDALDKVVHTFFDQADVRVSSEIAKELSKRQYDLAIDTSNMYLDEELKQLHPEGDVSRTMRFMNLNKKPEVVDLYNPTTVVMDITKIVAKYLQDRTEIRE